MHEPGEPAAAGVPEDSGHPVPEDEGKGRCRSGRRKAVDREFSHLRIGENPGILSIIDAMILVVRTGHQRTLRGNYSEDPLLLVSGNCCTTIVIILLHVLSGKNFIGAIEKYVVRANSPFHSLQIQNMVENHYGINAGYRKSKNPAGFLSCIFYQKDRFCISKKSDDFFSSSLLLEIKISHLEEPVWIVLKSVSLSELRICL